MPSFPPRTEAIKKENQLARRKTELKSAIRKNVSKEKYRAAQLSLYKAKIHVLKEKHIKGILKKKRNTFNLSAIEIEKETWENKTVEEILGEFN